MDMMVNPPQWILMVKVCWNYPLKYAYNCCIDLQKYDQPEIRESAANENSKKQRRGNGK
jgi:hypothetical protein